MRFSIAWLFVVSQVLCAAAEADRSAWQWAAPLDVRQTGMVRLEVPPPVLDVARPDLGDLRVLSPSAVETPYLIEQPARRMGAMRDAGGFKVALSGRTTVIEVAPGFSEAFETIQLVSPAREFLKSVTIEGRQGGDEWRKLAENEVVFRQASGVERLTIKVAAGVWDGLRCTLDDARSQPVPFTGVRVFAAGANPVSVESPAVLGVREEVTGETRLTLDLGARNLNVAELRFEIPDAVFSRTCRLGISTPAADGGTRMESVATGVLYRVVGDHGGSVQELVIPLQQRISAKYLVATFRNGDSPPLTITGAHVRCYPTVLAFHAAAAGAWQLLAGNPRAKAPDYDLNPLRASLAGAGGQNLTAGPLQARPGYQLPPALPGVEPAGADIGLTDWSCRRAVRPVPTGVIRIELDALALAACRLDLGDLRLVQNGRQIPYLIKPGTAMREIATTMRLVAKDPKRPTVSQWEVTLPVAGLPAVDLTANSPAAMFVRRVVATVERKDELGNTRTEPLGAADWTKSGGSEVPLILALHGQRLPRVFMLETDHGDNPPIPVERVVVHYAAPSITAKLTDGAPLFLYYGNPRAVPPQYDLQLVRTELLAADQQPAGLGDEELLRPVAGEKRGVDAGSPWLWLALAGVVVALLVIVAKLLPRPVA